MIRAIAVWAAVAALAACGGPATTPTAPKPPATPATTTAPATPTSTDAALTGVVRKLRVEGVGASLRGQVDAALGGATGKPLDPDRLREQLGAVMNLEGVADVSVEGVQLSDGIELVIRVTPQPTIHKLTAVEVGGKDIALGIAAIPDGSVLDPKRIQSLARTLHDRYATAGFYDVEVTWRKRAAAGGVDVVIEVTPGPATTVGSVGFKGNTIASKLLAAEISKLVVVGDPVVIAKLDAAVTALSAYYWDHGYANVKIVSPKPAAGRNALVFTIEEGPRFRMGTIEVIGVADAERAKYLKLFGVKKGDVFNRSALAKGRQRMVDALVASGKPNANVLPLTKVDLSGRTIGLKLEVEPGSP